MPPYELNTTYRNQCITKLLISAIGYKEQRHSYREDPVFSTMEQFPATIALSSYQEMLTSFTKRQPTFTILQIGQLEKP